MLHPESTALGIGSAGVGKAPITPAELSAILAEAGAELAQLTSEDAFKDAAGYSDWKFVYVPRISRRRHNPVPPAAD